MIWSQKQLGGDASENGDFQRGKQRLQGTKFFQRPTLGQRWRKFSIKNSSQGKTTFAGVQKFQVEF